MKFQKSKSNFIEKKTKKKKENRYTYLHMNNLLKQGVFLRKPSFNEIKKSYPFQFNFKLINEYIKKK